MGILELIYTIGQFGFVINKFRDKTLMLMLMNELRAIKNTTLASKRQKKSKDAGEHSIDDIDSKPKSIDTLIFENDVIVKKWVKKVNQLRGLISQIKKSNEQQQWKEAVIATYENRINDFKKDILRRNIASQKLTTKMLTKYQTSSTIPKLQSKNQTKYRRNYIIQSLSHSQGSSNVDQAQFSGISLMSRSLSIDG